VIVVDSLGTGAIANLVASEGWSHVSYHSADVNLGSAGNLAKRLELAAETGCKYVYALNHDGHLDAAVLRELIRAADELPRAGAAYPHRYLEQAGRFDSAGRHSPIPLPAFRRSAEASSEPYPVFWSSSNGALYALEPVRRGLLPWADLWMGWEDLGYGWLLHTHGYAQIVVPRAAWRDDYEYRTHRLLGRTVRITDKAPWYAYYQGRNLLLIARRLRRPARDYAALTANLLLEVGVTALFRDQKALRYRLFASGIADALRSRAGKGRVP
jgi:GT2 family glycosyltransferase